MEQYVSDNDRLRKKVSDIGERMEFYREKLVKYRTMYFEMTGQDPNQRPLSSSSQPSDRPSSTSSAGRENELGMEINYLPEFFINICQSSFLNQIFRWRCYNRCGTKQQGQNFDAQYRSIQFY